MGNYNRKHNNRYMAAGNSYLAKKKLEDAERNFASALKAVYKQEFKAYETAVALKGLGFVYKERGRMNKNGEDLVKASGLFISALNRLESCCNDELDQNEKTSKDSLVQRELVELKVEINAVHTLFIREIIGSQLEGLSNDHQKVEYYKETLNKTRDECLKKIKAMDGLPTVNPDEREIAVELERVKHTQRVYAEISKSMRELVANMVEDCVEMMPCTPPCRYSILGLGSTAREEATPYSDLEFCILVEKDTKEVLEYFTNLTNFLHLKVVELGETILPSLGISSLNDYYSEKIEDDWFYDSGPRGFSFDGAMPWASKVPTGRDKTMNKPWVESLIKTPQDMAALLSEKSVRKEGYRLADVLSTCVLICGDQSLFEDYVANKRKTYFEDDAETESSCVSVEGEEKMTARKERILQELVNVEQQYHTSLANYIRKTGGSYAIKKDFYRFPSLVVEYLGQYYNIESSSSWETIDKLESAKGISSDGGHNLRVALSIASELRLRAYLDNRSQNEYFNDLLALVARHDAPKHLAMVLQRFFFTVVPLENVIRRLPETGNLLHLKDCVLYDNNPKIKAQMYMQFKQHYKATQMLQDVVTEKLQFSTNNDATEERELAEICKILGNALFRNENGQEAIKYYEKAMDINEKLYQNDPVPYNAKALGDIYLNYGGCLCALGSEKKALPYLKKALEIRRFSLERSFTTLETITRLQDLVDALSNLSKVYTFPPTSEEVSLFFYHNHDAVKICEVLQQKYKVFYDHHSGLYFHQGLMYYDLRKFEESAQAYETGLELFYTYRKYDLNTEHEAAFLNNLGNALIALGNLDKARSLHTRAYEIRKQVHGGKDHNSIARSLNNFGLISEEEGNIREAYDWYVQARDMSERINGADSSYAHLQMYRRNVKRNGREIAKVVQ